MHEVIKRIWVGDQDDAPKAFDKNFAVCSVVKEGPVGHRSVLKYTTLAAPHDENYYYVIRGKHFAGNLLDLDDPDFTPSEVINPALEFIKKHYDSGDDILIHCERGHSRGPSVCLMFLKTISEMPYPFVRAEKIFRTLYPKYDPASGIRSYAREHWKELGKDARV